MSAPLRVGLIGAGAMGSLHARVVSTSERSHLAWVSDPRRAVAEPIAERYRSRWSAEPDLSDVDAVVIASPTQFHHGQAIEVIRAGLPLLIEKPLADTFEHCRDLVEKASDAGIPLMCGLLERFNPAVRTAFDISSDPLHVITVRNSPYVERIRTGVASDLLIHDLDLVLQLFGEEPASATSQIGYLHPLSEPTSEDMIDASLSFERGQVATLSASRLSQRKVRTLTITELDRLIEVDLLRQDITIYRNVGGVDATDDGDGYRQQTIIEIPVLRHIGEPLGLQWSRFLDLIEEPEESATEARTLLAPHRAVFQLRDHAARRQIGG